MQDDTSSGSIEQVETLPEGAVRAKLVEGPEGELYFVPETGPSAEITGAVPETTTEPGSSLFASADPILGIHSGGRRHTC